MSEHSLSPDPSSWPRDPFRLLGVPPGASARDLRKAYLRLIRSYKPEHAPEEFKRIRDAYESALPFARTDQRAPIIDEPGPEPPTESGTGLTTEISIPAFDRIPPLVDAWKFVLRGEPETAYRTLVDRHDAARGSEDDYVQLYWLLTLLPSLELARTPVDWIVRGLGARGADAPRLRELLRRELAANPTLTLGDRLKNFLRRRTPPVLAVEFAEARWRLAREAGRWGVIAVDVESLRAWLPDADENAWARLLIASAMNLAWADGRDANLANVFAREVESLGSRHRDYADELHQLEYAQRVKLGLDRLKGLPTIHVLLGRLLPGSWDEPGPAYRARLRAYVDLFDGEPLASLRCLDHIQSVAPFVLGRLSALLGGFDDEAYYLLGPARLDEVSPVIRRFLDSHAWTDYPAVRPNLLKFCLLEAISPGLVARTLADRAEFILSGTNPLAHKITEDWPLRHAYRASEMTRETPE
jgi:hypothetical protein